MRTIIKILQSVGAIITNDHFVYTSGKHGEIYINKAALYPHAKESSEVGKLFAKKFQDYPIDIIVSPALGGIILSQWTAYHLSKLKGYEVTGVFTEKALDGTQVLNRGYDLLVKDKKVLVVEDVTTTGNSIKYTIDAIRKASGQVIAACSMINRDPDNINSNFIGAPFSALGVLKAEAYDPPCPLCKRHIPINQTLGHPTATI